MTEPKVRNSNLNVRRKCHFGNDGLRHLTGTFRIHANRWLRGQHETQLVFGVGAHGPPESFRNLPFQTPHRLALCLPSSILRR